MEVSAVNTLLDLLHLREVYLFTLAFRRNPVLPAILQAAIQVELQRLLLKLHTCRLKKTKFHCPISELQWFQ